MTAQPMPPRSFHFHGIRALPGVLIISLAAGLWLAAPSLRAQEPHGAAQPAQGQVQPPQEGGHPGEHGAQPQEGGHAGEQAAAHEAQPQEGGHGAGQAAGQAAGHGASHGPEVRLPGVAHPLSQHEQFALKAINFLIFAAVLYFTLRGILGAAFKARARDLEERLGASQREKAEADARIQELEARMAGLREELAGIMDKAARDSEAEKQRTLEAARQEAEQILSQAREGIVLQQRQAEQELRALVAGLAAEGAARRLEAQLAGGLSGKVMDRAIEDMGGVQ